MGRQGGGNDADAVATAVGLGASGDHSCVEEVVAELTGEPVQVTHVTVVEGVGQFHFEGYNAAVGAFDDQINLVLAGVGAEVPDSGFGGLGVDPHVEGDERFE